MTRDEIKSLIDDTLTVLRAAREGVTPKVLKLVDGIAIQVKARIVLQQSFRLAVNMSPDEVIEAAEDTQKIVRVLRKAVEDKTIDRWIAALERLQGSPAMQAVIDLFV